MSRRLWTGSRGCTRIRSRLSWSMAINVAIRWTFDRIDKAGAVRRLEEVALQQLAW